MSHMEMTKRKNDPGDLSQKSSSIKHMTLPFKDSDHLQQTRSRGLGSISKSTLLNPESQTASTNPLSHNTPLHSPPHTAPSNPPSHTTSLNPSPYPKFRNHQLQMKSSNSCVEKTFRQVENTPAPPPQHEDESPVLYKCLGEVRPISCHELCTVNMTFSELLFRLQKQDKHLHSCIDECIENNMTPDYSVHCQGIEIEDRRLLDYFKYLIDICISSSHINKDLFFTFCIQEFIEAQTQGDMSLISRRNDRVIGSCKNRCGDLTTFPCACNKRCLLSNDCCLDFAHTCPAVARIAREITSSLPEFSFAECTHISYRMITRCPGDSEPMNLHFDETFDAMDPFEKTFGRKVSLLNTPYTDEATGIAYSNKLIFDCNTKGTSSKGIPWKYHLALTDFNVKSTSLNDILASMDYRCTTYIPPVRSDTCPFLLVNNCPEVGYFDVITVLLCAFSAENRVLVKEGIDLVVLKNKYCAVCSHDWNVKTYLPADIERHLSCMGNDSPHQVTISLSGPEIQMQFIERNTTALGQSYKRTQMRCRNTFNIPAFYALNYELDFVCENTDCSSGDNIRGNNCKHDTLLLFSVPDEGNHFTHKEADAIPMLWQCFLHNWVRIDPGNGTTYRLEEGVEDESVHVSMIQVYVEDKQEFNALMTTEYIKSGVMYLTDRVKNYRKNRTIESQIKPSEAMTTFCYGHFYQSGQAFSNEFSPPCFADNDGGRTGSTVSIDQCLVELQATLDTDSGQTSLQCFIQLPITMSAWCLLYYQV